MHIGLERLEAPSVAYALRQLDVPSQGAQIFCHSLYALCDLPPVRNFTIPLPKQKSIKQRPQASNEKSLYVVHLSDLHVDHKYTVGASYNCSESICCRQPEVTVGGNASFPAGAFGEHYCNSPVSLEQSQFDAIHQLVPNRAFTITTGDIVEGAVWETTNREIVYDVADAYTRMARTLGQVYPAIGNHDAVSIKMVLLLHKLTHARTQSTVSHQPAW
jgi:sphingomyelin phosphodiesterase